MPRRPLCFERRWQRDRRRRRGPSAPDRTAPARRAPLPTRPDPLGGSSRGAQRGGAPSRLRSPVRPRHASAGADLRRRWARAQGGSHLRWQQQKLGSASDCSTAKEKLCKLFSMTL